MKCIFSKTLLVTSTLAMLVDQVLKIWVVYVTDIESENEKSTNRFTMFFGTSTGVSSTSQLAENQQSLKGSNDVRLAPVCLPFLNKGLTSFLSIIRIHHPCLNIFSDMIDRGIIETRGFNH